MKLPVTGAQVSHVPLVVGQTLTTFDDPGTVYGAQSNQM